MDTILVDNKNVQEAFYQMLQRPFQQYDSTRVLCLSAQSGKGKSTLVDYFSEYCHKRSVFSIRLDFDAFHLSGELELIDTIIDQFSILPEFSNSFVNYKESIQKLALKAAGDTIIQNVELMKTQIGTIHIKKDKRDADTQIAFIENAFFQDLKNAVQSQERVVFFFDAFERAPVSIQEWVKKKLILSKSLATEIIVVVAGQEELEFPKNAKDNYGIKAFRLPEVYEFDDWIEYGKRLKIADIDTIKRCYSCWGGDPFYMCVSLKPFANWGDI